MAYKFKNKILLVLLSSLLLVSCNNDEKREITSVPSNNVTKSTLESPIKEKVISYENYKEMFEHMDSNLLIDEFKLKVSSLGPDVTAIDKELSFNKREWLTVDGVMNNTDPDSTQEILYFEDNKQTTLIAINFSYTETYIGDDMVQYQVNSGYSDLNNELSVKTDFIVISYKNLIITVHQTSNEKVNIETTKLALQNVINELVKF